MRMMFAILFVSLFLLPAPVMADTQDKWPLCEQDSDCVVTRSPCGIIAVHTQYLKDAEAYWREVAPKVECATVGPTDLSNFKATCGFQKTACIKKNWLGFSTGIDHESTCVSTDKKCGISR